MYKNISIKVLCLSLCLAGCSTKSKPNFIENSKVVGIQEECGERTTMQGALIGTIAGGITSQLIQVTPLISAVVGGVIGTVGGYKLASMQCKYQDIEQTLLKKIQRSIKKQNLLTVKTNYLNKRMSKLYTEISDVQNQYHMTLAKKQQLQNEIILKKEEVAEIQMLNNDVIFITENYYNELEARNYSKTDKKNIKNSLNKVLTSLGSITESCAYNLEQLNKFESRVY